ncbi:MAG: acyloxyacyl hydrolase [Defluviimonas sp.]|uniref:acyloxyacyl hydrolase n=1 Tax=Albidovulum sp. TaxID=1872424 RepID=UPI001E14D800|nr:acyloxyacyl hydrolase [Paracoccaceae bacterium]MCC0063656.1 acyloxyacyl hydrolase [Defluviimonas sp.]
MIRAALVSALVAVSAPAHAADWVLGFGTTDFSAKGAVDSGLLVAELHGRAFNPGHRLAFKPGLAAVVDLHGDLWIRAGIQAELPFGQSAWFAEASVMPGFYDDALKNNDLGSAFEIRSLVGIGYGLAGGTRVSLAINHKSNAGIGSHNAGVNAVTMRFGRSF